MGIEWVPGQKKARPNPLNKPFREKGRNISTSTCTYNHDLITAVNLTDAVWSFGFTRSVLVQRELENSIV
jgi:hypothetical protein